MREIEEQIRKEFPKISLLNRGYKYFKKNERVYFDFNEKDKKSLKRSCATTCFRFLHTKNTAYLTILVFIIIYLYLVLSFFRLQ